MTTLDEAFRSHADNIRAYLATLVHPDDLDDAVADTFIDAYRGAGEQLSIADLLTAATRTAHTTNQTRTRNHQNTVHWPAHGTHLPQQTSAADLHELAEALRELPDTDRAALGLAVIGLDSHEAARILNCSRGAYRVRLHRARTQLRRTLAESNNTAKEDA